jgi:hypothetical protein
MITSPIDSKRNIGVTNTVIDLCTAPTTTPGYHFHGWLVDNIPNVAATYIQLFKAPASSVTLGSTVADFVIPVGGSSSQGFGFESGIIFPTGLSGAATTTKSGSTAPVTAVDVTILFRGA